MVYLAVLLVLTGLLIVLVALFSESGQGLYPGRRGSSTGGAFKKGLDPEDIDIIFPDMMEDTGRKRKMDVISGFDEGMEYNPAENDRRDDWGLNETGEDEVIPHSGPLEDMTDSTLCESGTGELQISSDSQLFSSMGASVSSVLFDDRSNLIDYDSGGSNIWASVSAYKNIKRVGSGDLQLDDDGLSFYMNDRLFRFDFHKIHDVWSGSNFVALPVKGGNSVKLFMFEGSAGFPERVEVNFQKYMKGI